MTDNLDDVFGINGSSSAVLMDSLKTITHLVAWARGTQVRIQEHEDAIKHEKEELRKLLEQDIPEAMSEAGMADIGLSDGTRVNVSAFHRGAITEKTKDAAHTWLEANGFGGLIKREFTVSFGKDDEGYEGLASYVKASGLSSKGKEAVHPQTLGAFIRNQAEKGESVPQDLFNVYSGMTTKLSNA